MSVILLSPPCREKFFCRDEERRIWWTANILELLFHAGRLLYLDTSVKTEVVPHCDIDRILCRQDNSTSRRPPQVGVTVENPMISDSCTECYISTTVARDLDYGPLANNVPTSPSGLGQIENSFIGKKKKVLMGSFHGLLLQHSPYVEKSRFCKVLRTRHL